MALPKVCGIETEYGIAVRGAAEANPMSASSLLINGYLLALGGADRGEPRPVGWDFEDESPNRDARGFTVEGPNVPEVDIHLVNTVLTNGARFYVDHAHPELSTPECPDPLTLVVYDRAGDEILRRAMASSRALLPPDQEIVVYKNNSDGKGNSYGCHENYLMDRAVPFGRIVRGVIPHFVTRQIFTGAGKVGVEAHGDRWEVPFQLSQRADFFEEEVGLETTLKRPIVNTRDEPHADPQRFRRLHVIVGDANLCEVATFLKVGTTALLLAMIEDEFPLPELDLENPVEEIRRVSRDVELGHLVRLKDGRRMSAIEIQWELYERSRKYADEQGLAALGDETVGDEVLRRWERVLSTLEADPFELAGQVDWVTKLRVFDAYRSREDLDWSDPKLGAMDLQYHDLRPERSLFARLPTERLTDDQQVNAAVEEPPRGTRAFFRGVCLRRWGSSVVAANWDSLVFDIGAETLRRVPMMDPTKGTADHTEALLDSCDSPRELIEKLAS
ncbi:MAG: proteasome accessory factor PafA2 [Acidimicrobiales bacterium]|nr:MAG: proteasome accessory factor PafA2 [Acidimicrobiales bacterium]